MYVLAVEALCVVHISYKSSQLRVIMSEVTRIFNTLLAGSCAIFDLGSLSPLLWSFEEREKFMSVFEWVSGVRMHVAYLCIGGLLDDLNVTNIDFLNTITTTTELIWTLIEITVVTNRILYLRLRGLAILDYEDINACGITGILLRATGLPWDLRITNTYEIYATIGLDIYTGVISDCYDRLIIRNLELKTTCYIMYSYTSKESNTTIGDIYCIDASIENLIFAFGHTQSKHNQGIACKNIEASKGEYTYTIATNATWQRNRIKCADFIHTMLLDILTKGLMISDLVALIGNIDIVFGSVDR
jgi:NADH-quinone oxidoreductase subunit D